MKKLFAVLSILVLTFSMSSLVLAKDFSDVKGTKYSDSVKMLTELKVISGYEDNTFKPNKEIKRSEMAKMLIVALGKESSVKTQVTKQTFPDVGTGHWAAGYIELASELNLIKGYPNGKFAPDNKVSYVEAVAMMLRALNYNDEIANLTWPDGYMQKASDIKLVKNVSYNNANDYAVRGEVSNMLWNTMNAYTRKKTINDAYVSDVKLLEKAFSDKYIYITDSDITDIDFSKETITVKVNNKNTEFVYDGTETELKKLYGRKIVNALYNKKDKEFVVFELDSSEKSIYGVVSDVKDEFLYIGKSAYEIPNSKNIMLVGISDIEAAEEAFIVTSGTTVKSMLCEGSEELYIGIVVDNDVEIDEEDGIAVETLNGEKEYVLADSGSKIYKGDVIIYALNSKKELVIKKAVDIDDSLEITSLSSSAIKLEGESKVTLSTLDEYVIVMVEDDKYIEEINLDEADKSYDTAVIVKEGKTSYIIVFYDGLELVENSDNEEEEDEDAELNIGVVLDDYIKINSKAGIEIETLKGEKEYILNDSAEDLNEEDVIIYTLNSKDELIVKEIITLEDSLEITSLSSSAIKLDGKTKLTLSPLGKYEIVMVENGNTIMDADLTDADKDYDSAVITKIGTTTFIVIFYDGLEFLEEAAEEEAMTKTEAKSALSTAIKNAKNKKESNYTIASWEKLKTALKTAENINTSTASASTIQSAAKNLNTAISGLKAATTSDKNLRTKFNNLQSLIADAEDLNKNDYTADSYAKVSTALTAAKKIVIASTTVAKVETAISNLDSAMKLLVTNTTAENMQEAKARLEKAKADAAVIKKEDYTEETYNKLQSALDAAKTIDYTKDGSTVINNVARNIEEALVALVSKADAEKSKAIDTLKGLINEAKTLEANKAKYTANTWKKVQDELDKLSAYNNVYTNLETSQIKTYTSTLQAAIDGLEEILKRDNLISQLEGVIELAEKQAEDAWIGSSTWTEFQTALTNAKATYDAKDGKTYKQLETAYNTLCNCLGI